MAELVRIRLQRGLRLPYGPTVGAYGPTRHLRDILTRPYQASFYHAVGSMRLLPRKQQERCCYRGTSLIRNSPPLGPYRGPYSRPMPRALWWSEGGWRFLMSEVPLYHVVLRGVVLPPALASRKAVFFFFIALKPRVE